MKKKLFILLFLLLATLSFAISRYSLIHDRFVACPNGYQYINGLNLSSLQWDFNYFYNIKHKKGEMIVVIGTPYTLYKKDGHLFVMFLTRDINGDGLVESGYFLVRFKHYFPVNRDWYVIYGRYHAKAVLTVNNKNVKTIMLEGDGVYDLATGSYYGRTN